MVKQFQGEWITPVVSTLICKSIEGAPIAWYFLYHRGLEPELQEKDGKTPVSDTSLGQHRIRKTSHSCSRRRRSISMRRHCIVFTKRRRRV